MGSSTGETIAITFLALILLGAIASLSYLLLTPFPGVVPRTVQLQQTVPGNGCRVSGIRC